MAVVIYYGFTASENLNAAILVCKNSDANTQVNSLTFAVFS